MWMIIPVRTSERHESQHINNWKHTTCTDVEQCFPADLYHTPKRFISHYRSVFWTFPTHTYCFPANCSLSLSVFQSDSDLAKQKQTLTGWDLFVSASDNTFGDQSQEPFNCIFVFLPLRLLKKMMMKIVWKNGFNRWQREIWCTVTFLASPWETPPLLFLQIDQPKINMTHD